jgi:hypothetical protein
MVIRPSLSSDAEVMSARVDDFRCSATAASTRSAYSSENVTR